MKFIGIWILNPLKTSGGQLVALRGFGVWLGGYFLAWILIDTIIHLCFKHAVSHVPGFIHLDIEVRAAKRH